MSNDLPERPAPGRRRTPKPASDVNIDPIDSSPSGPTATSNAGPIGQIQDQKILRVPFSNRLAQETLDILGHVKADTKLKIYEAIEIAVAEKWGHYIKK